MPIVPKHKLTEVQFNIATVLSKKNKINTTRQSMINAGARARTHAREIKQSSLTTRYLRFDRTHPKNEAVFISQKKVVKHPKP